MARLAKVVQNFVCFVSGHKQVIIAKRRFMGETRDGGRVNCAAVRFCDDAGARAVNNQRNAKLGGHGGTVRLSTRAGHNEGVRMAAS